ncbi:MAG: hypothetical protein GF329_15360 [Candidatus Lokiarchaeota archaeon]|nr:hypothetical protein [Candidatus Lokiarchaeota archaeon]
MRNRRGRQKFNRTKGNKNISSKRNFNRTRVAPKQINGYTYVGACRCGLGPNAYYKNNKSGEIKNYSEIQNTNNQQNSVVQINTPRNRFIQNNNRNIDRKQIEKKLLDESDDSSDDEVRFCANCGNELYPNAYYCSECGAFQQQVVSKKEIIQNLKEKIRNIKYKIKDVKKRG